MPIPPYECPLCGHGDSLTDITGQSSEPSPGDKALCAGCAGWSVFDAGPDGTMLRRVANPAEQAELDADPQTRRLSAVIRGEEDYADTLWGRLRRHRE